MGTLKTLTFLLTTAPACSAFTQTGQQFIVVTVFGEVKVWSVPEDWRPIATSEYVQFADQGRMRTDRIAAIKPRHGDVLPDGYHDVTLWFTTSRGDRKPQVFAVPNHFKTINSAPKEGAFFRLDERTLIRENAFSTEPRNR
jgi:hypothetical protein